MDEFETGIENTRNPEELLSLINAKLDLFEIIQTMEYVVQKYAEEGSGKYDENDMEFVGGEEVEPEKSTVDITLNLNSDYFRLVKVEYTPTDMKYSLMCQVDFDNLVWEVKSDADLPDYENLIQRLRTFGSGKFKAEGEKKYLLDGGKSQQEPELDRSMLLKKV